MTAGVDGAGEQPLSTRKLPEFLDYPAWSPDGERIAYTVGRHYQGADEVRVAEVRLKDKRERPISTRNWYYVIQLSWLGDGTGLLMSAREENLWTFQIWHLSYPDGAARKLTTGLSGLTGVSVSKDASAIVSVQDTLMANIWVEPAAGAGQASQVTFGTGLTWLFSWLRDGRIIYEQSLNGVRNVWQAGANGGEATQLTIEAGCYNSSVSPDGRSIACISNQAGDSTLWTIGIDGHNRRRIARVDASSQPQWTPDEKWIVYEARGALQWPVLWKASVEGGAPVQLTGKLSVHPAVSPEGTEVACFYESGPLHSTHEPSSIAVISIDGGPPRNVLAIPPTVFQFAGVHWTPDGKSLAYADRLGAVSSIWTQPVAGGPAKKLKEYPGERIFGFEWSRDGKSLALARGSSPMSDAVLIRDAR